MRACAWCIEHGLLVSVVGPVVVVPVFTAVVVSMCCVVLPPGATVVALFSPVHTIAS
jgi:hypothetical protein